MTARRPDVRPPRPCHPGTPALLRLSRPWFWPLGWVAAYVGAVLGSGEWIPEAVPWWQWPVAGLVLGPLVWTAVVSVNDLHDVATDLRNPRKAEAPLVTGELSDAEAMTAFRVGSVAAVLVASVIGPAFAVGTAFVVVCGWLYSAPPVRLKGRAGWDVAVNAGVVGFLAPLAGWTLVRPMVEYPLALASIGAVLVAALYLPTTIVDVAADTASGVHTSAVRWSPRRCRALSIVLWVAGLAGWLAFARHQSPGPGVWVWQASAAPALVASFVWSVTRPSMGRLVATAGVLLVPMLAYLNAYVASGRPR